MKKLENSLCYLIVTLILWIGFNSNPFNQFPEEWFDNFQSDSESLILGRIAISRVDGVFSYSGLPGRVDTKPESQKGAHDSWYKVPWEFQSEAVTGKSTFSYFIPYRSQNGGQGILFSVLDYALPFDTGTKLSLFHTINSFLSAATVALIITFIFLEFGWISASVTLLLLMISPWFMVFGKNLWWCLWPFYIPFISTAIVFNHFSKHVQRSTAILYIIPASAYFLKCLFTGFEFITTCILMTLIPIVYISIKKGFSVQSTIQNCARVLIGISVSIFMSISILNFQITAESGIPNLGINHLIEAVERRGNGSLEDIESNWHETSQRVVSIIESYLNTDVFTVEQSIEVGTIKRMTFLTLSLIFLTATIILLFIPHNNYHFRLMRSKRNAMIISTWLSICAPLSWLIFFSKHALEHFHLDNIIWYMPYCIGGFTILGVCMSLFVEALFRHLLKFVKTNDWN